MATVSFNYVDFSTRYPEFDETVSPGLARLYFEEAGIYLDPTDTSMITIETKRKICLYMITAHIAALNRPGGSDLVGRISNATEGSVTVQAEMAQPGTGAWFMQTKYGAAYWQATSQYRSGFYIAPQSRNMDPYNPLHGDY